MFSCLLISEPPLFYIQNNNLQGSMPAGIGNLRRLKKLYLQNNLLEGRIDEVEHLSALTRLIVENNRFAGTIPSDMGELISLEEGASHHSISLIRYSFSCILTSFYSPQCEWDGISFMDIFLNRY